MNKKQTIRLNESRLRRIVSESVKRVLKEEESPIAINPKKIEAYKKAMNPFPTKARNEHVREAFVTIYRYIFEVGEHAMVNPNSIQEMLDDLYKLEARVNNLLGGPKLYEKKSAKRMLKEYSDEDPYDEDPYAGYYYCISSCNKKLENLSCVEEEGGFKTPEDAYNDGLEQLRYYNDGIYMLEVYHFITRSDGGHVGDYDSGYMAVSKYGKIREY